jgi:DNA-binding IclR family transcriptional regulator
MAYSVLQLISRSRDGGMPVDDMTKTTGYSSGTLFYLVKTLQDLALM